MTVPPDTGRQAAVTATARDEPGGRRVVRSAAARFVSSFGVLLMAAGLWQGGTFPGSVGSLSAVPSAEAPEAGTAPVLARARPVRLTIPAIDVDVTDLVALNVDTAGMLEAPEDADTVGWYGSGPWPGQAGPAVLGAHVDSLSGPAVFFRLRELGPGDEVAVGRADGTEAVFHVYEVREYDKDAFPTDRVYGSTANRAELRLVTCGGEFERRSGNYTGNVVVYAKLDSPV
ncbi:class F sortase [Nocardiopsis quinghaiensis]|uniref:class F sortase n=1 Tax=Nocardiopsis quinghaiensis TaxID=464995 RepID=UPI00123B748E|nr:class F sortase [Nocardiopsis quinghaiensis]